MRAIAVAALLLITMNLSLAQGEEWQLLELPQTVRVTSLFEFNGKLYATGGGLYSVDGPEFTLVKAPDGSELWPTRFLPYSPNKDEKLAPITGAGGFMVASSTKQLFLIDGTDVRPLALADGSALRGTPSRFAIGDPSCPYFVVGRFTYKVENGRASQLDLPKELLAPHIVVVEGRTIFAVGDKYWFYEDGVLSRVLNEKGEELTGLSVTAMQAFGPNLLIRGRDEHFLCTIKDKSFVLIEVPARTDVWGGFKLGERLILQYGNSGGLSFHEVVKNKLEPVDTLNKLNLNSIVVRGKCALVSGSESVYLFDGKAAKKLDLPKRSGIDAGGWDMPKPEDSVLGVIHSFETGGESGKDKIFTYWTVTVSGVVVKLFTYKKSDDQKVGDISYFKPAVGLKGLYAERHVVKDFDGKLMGFSENVFKPFKK